MECPHFILIGQKTWLSQAILVWSINVPKKTFLTETTVPIGTKLWRNGVLKDPLQNWPVKNMKPTSNSCFRLANMQNNFSETHDHYFVGTVDMSRIDLTYICDLHFVGTYLDSYVDYMLNPPSVYDLCWNKHLGHKKKIMMCMSYIL